MSLRVWLPLMGDLHNQGLDDISLTASANSSVSQGGKIGSCYQFGTSTSSYLKFNNVNFIKNFTECSVSLWVKILTWQSSYNTYFQFGFSGVSWAHYIFGLLRNSTGSTLCFTISNGISATNANCLTPSLELNKWYHITLTYKDGHCKIYINGQMTKDYSTSIVPDFSKVTFGTIGAGGPSGGSYQTNSQINDFRVYDHCLSQKEVKEISKGLIVHYPLDNEGCGNPNLITKSMLASQPWAGGYYGDEYYKGKTAMKVSSSYMYSRTSNGTTCIFPSLTFEPGVQYTLSLDWCDHLRTDNYTSSMYLRFRYTDGTTSAIVSPTANNDADWVHKTLTSTAGKDVEALTTTYGRGGTISIANLKLEKGTIETSWSPPIDEIDNTIEDCSGFGNNGVVWKYDTEGEFELNTNSPKYNFCSYINSLNSTSNAASGTVYIYGECPLVSPNQLTVSFWCNPQGGYAGQTGQGQFSLTNNSIGSNAANDYQTAPMNHRDSAVDINSGSTHKRLSIDFTKNAWHYYTIVYDGRYGKAYKDGVQTSTIDMGAELSFDNMKAVVIGFSKAGGVWRRNKSYYSDFRFYVTALSDEDILELYHTGQSIDNENNLYAYEVTEIE